MKTPLGLRLDLIDILLTKYLNNCVTTEQF